MSALLAYRLRLGMAMLLAFGTLAAAISLAVPLSAPDGSFSGPVPIAAVSEARADAALAASPPLLAEARAQTRATLTQRPMDAVAWTRLAWLASETRDREAMLDALDRSYAVAPFGPDVTGWRLRFAFGHWSDLTPDLRRQVAAELFDTVHNRPSVADAVRSDIADPAGRLAFDLTRSSASAR